MLHARGSPGLVRREFPFLLRKSQFRSLYLGGPHPPIQRTTTWYAHARYVKKLNQLKQSHQDDAVMLSLNFAASSRGLFVSG